jgi:hypothetical protein
VQATIDALPSQGGEIASAGSFGISVPIVIDKPWVKVRGYAPMQTSRLKQPCEFRKLAGFAGQAGIVIGNNKTARSHVTLENIIVVSDPAEAGGGIFAQNYGNLRFHNVVTRGHQGVGITLDGIWLSSFYNLNARNCQSGGILLSGDTRRCANIEFYSPVVQLCAPYHWRFTGDATIAQTSPASIVIIGGITEFPEAASTTLVQLDCGQNINWTGGSIASATGSAINLIEFGNDTVADPLEDIIFSGMSFQITDGQAFVASGNNVIRLSVVKPRMQHYAIRTVFDLTTMTTGTVLAEDVKFLDVKEIVDPNHRIAVRSTHGISQVEALNPISWPFQVRQDGDAFPRSRLGGGSLRFGTGSADTDAWITRRGPGMVGTPDDQGFRIGNGNWDGGFLRMGNHRIWVDASGKLRIKGADPTSDTDGKVVGTQQP